MNIVRLDVESKTLGFIPFLFFYVKTFFGAILAWKHSNSVLASTSHKISDLFTMSIFYMQISDDSYTVLIIHCMSMKQYFNAATADISCSTNVFYIPLVDTYYFFQ